MQSKSSAKTTGTKSGHEEKRAQSALRYSFGTAKNPEMVFQFAREGATRADLIQADRVLQRMINKLSKLKTTN